MAIAALQVAMAFTVRLREQPAMDYMATLLLHLDYTPVPAPVLMPGILAAMCTAQAPTMVLKKKRKKISKTWIMLLILSIS